MSSYQSVENAVTELAAKNEALAAEVKKIRNFAVGVTTTFLSTAEGMDAVQDGGYFSVLGDTAYLKLYRRDGTVAVLEAEYPDKATLDAAVQQAVQDATFQASTYADASAQSASKAQQWAEEAENVEVEPGEYSAKHWAAQAQAIAQGAAANISYDALSSGLEATSVQAAIDEIVGTITQPDSAEMSILFGS